MNSFVSFYSYGFCIFVWGFVPSDKITYFCISGQCIVIMFLIVTDGGGSVLLY